MVQKFSIFLKTILFSVIIIAGFASCNKNPNTFSLKGTIENMDGNKIIFVRDYPDSILIDTIKADKDGYFSYKGSTDTLMLGTLFFNDGSTFTSVFFNKGDKIKIKGNANYPDLIEIRGNDINNALSDFKKDNEKILKSRAKLIDNFQNIRKTDVSPHPLKPDPGMISKVSNLTYQLKTKAAEYIRKNPEKIASVILIQDLFKDSESIDQMNNKLQSLKEPAASFPLTNELKQYVNKIRSSKVGETAPNFDFERSKDKRLRNGNYLNNYLILSFTSNEGPLCQKQKEELADIYKEYKDKKVKILSIIVNENNKQENKQNAKFAKSADSITIDWDVVTLKEGWKAKILADYNVTELPLYILINERGKIIAREESPEMFTGKLPKKKGVKDLND